MDYLNRVFAIGNIIFSMTNIVPQLLLLLETRSSYGISLNYLTLRIGSHIVNTIYSYNYWLTNTLAISIYHLSSNVTFLAMVLRFRSERIKSNEIAFIIGTAAMDILVYEFPLVLKYSLWVTNTLFAVAAIIQLYKIYTTKNVANISIRMLYLKVLGDFCFLGTVTTNNKTDIQVVLPWIIGISVTLLLDAVELVQYYHYRDRNHHYLEILDFENVLENEFFNTDSDTGSE